LRVLLGRHPATVRQDDNELKIITACREGVAR